MTSYNELIEQKMKKVYNTLNERDRRRYAAIEALKLGHGGITYISKVLGCDRKTVAKGVKELEELEELEELTTANHADQQNELENKAQLDQAQPQINDDSKAVNLACEEAEREKIYHYEFHDDNQDQNRAMTDEPQNKSQENQIQQQSELKAAQQSKNEDESKKNKDKDESKVNQKSKKNKTKQRIRKSGAGRKRKSKAGRHAREEIPSLDQKILDILANHTAGDPMKEGVIWTNLRAGQISELLKKKHQISVSLKVIRKILKKHGYSRRKAKKSESMKQVENRNEQFENTARRVPLGDSSLKRAIREFK